MSRFKASIHDLVDKHLHSVWDGQHNNGMPWLHRPRFEGIRRLHNGT